MWISAKVLSFGSRQEDPRHARAWKLEMQNAHDAVVTTMQPLLHGWLQYPKDGQTSPFLGDVHD